MSSRTSPAEVRGLLRRVISAANDAGIDTTGWAVDRADGPTAFGGERSWRLLALVPGRLLPFDVLGGGGFLGRTDREAAISLNVLERAFRLAAQARRLAAVD